MTKNGKVILKIIVWAILLHIILIGLTILEVFLYSTFFNPGQDNQFYEKHAEQSAPYIAILAGFVLTYWVAARMIKKNPAYIRTIGVGLPIGYIFFDILILILSGTEVVNHFWVFTISYATKISAGYLAIKIAR